MPRYNLQIKVITYVGTGVAQDITGVGFRPQYIFTKGGANIACFRTEQMLPDKTAYFAGNTAHFSGGIAGSLNDGFRVGTDAKVNANGTTYYALCISGTDAQEAFRIFTYLGNNTDNRELNLQGINFDPDIAFVKGDTAQNPSVHTVDTTTDNAWHFSGSADAANEIQDLITDGLQLGTSPRANGSNIEYHGIALKHISEVVASGKFVGNAVDGRAITGVGFSGDYVLVKNGTTTNAAVVKTSDFSALESASVGSAGPTTGLIKTIDSDGFTVGSNVAVNGDGNIIYWWVLKAGDFFLPISRTAV